ncbi:hypothetical protein ZIOFF_040645 [Zingiber officinale]|uniref:Uncharacterized protein n=1 Tax=Zingiber officinale TaxID=94328 RepID=A0A8J5G5H1_ZINOF|nr:hypothetical protein ZIOFF_040645 [Zingiber officinale]
MPNLTQSTPNSSNSNHSQGSFGPVFIVLGAIVVLTIVSYVIGRLCTRHCSRRSNSSHGDIEDASDLRSLDAKQREIPGAMKMKDTKHGEISSFQGKSNFF